MGITQAYEWAIKICNMESPYALYTQNTDASKGPTRYGGTDGEGNVYYDCSSFVSAALTEGGFFSKNPWFTTSTMRDKLTAAGFTLLSKTDEIKPGDICWRSGHTEMVYGVKDGKILTMGAHTSKASKAGQVSIGSSSGSQTYKIPYQSWTQIYGYRGGHDDITPTDPGDDMPSGGDSGEHPTGNISPAVLILLLKRGILLNS